MARPKIDISAEQVQKLASIGCKNTEIADFFGVSADTVERNYAGDLAKGRASLKMSLRQWQLRAAERGNATMLVWLGKQSLGQVDRILNEHSGVKITEEGVSKLSNEELLQIAHKTIEGFKQ